MAARHDDDLTRTQGSERKSGGGSTQAPVRRGRSVPALYSGVAVLLVVAVVAVAYGTQAPQLGVAEFAPAARQAVEPPPTTAGDAGSPAAAARRRSPRTTQPTTSTTAATDASGSASAPTTQAARARSCVGNPPRQTDDPQSPPCITVIFEGDNGGATSTGVTGTEIKVAIPNASADAKAMAAAYLEFFNQRYEFYGRKLVPVYTTGGFSDPVQARQLAADIGSRQVFAGLTSQLDWGTPPPAFLNESARKGVVTMAVDRTGLLTDSAVYDSLDPYIWSVFPSVEQKYRAATDLICQSLAGKPARHAGTPELRGLTRRFAIVAMANQVLPPTGELEAGVAACGDLVPTVKFLGAGLPANSVRTALSKLKASGVTTVVCVCGDATFPGSFMGDAVAAGYFPEWLPLYSYAAEEFYGAFINPGSGYDQLSNILMMTPNHKSTPLQVRPSFQVMLAMRPDLISKLGTTVTFDGDLIYKELSMLAAGIQGAGPALTPDSFKQALMTMQFPNPGAGQAPYWQQAVGFSPGDHSFYDDFALAWWNRGADVVDPGAPLGKGSLCYVGQGARYRPGTFPADADSLFFDSSKPCR